MKHLGFFIEAVHFHEKQNSFSLNSLIIQTSKHRLHDLKPKSNWTYKSIAELTNRESRFE